MKVESWKVIFFHVAVFCLHSVPAISLLERHIINSTDVNATGAVSFNSGQENNSCDELFNASSASNELSTPTDAPSNKSKNFHDDGCHGFKKQNSNNSPDILPKSSTSEGREMSKCCLFEDPNEQVNHVTSLQVTSQAFLETTQQQPQLDEPLEDLPFDVNEDKDHVYYKSSILYDAVDQFWVPESEFQMFTESQTTFSSPASLSSPTPSSSSQPSSSSSPQSSSSSSLSSSGRSNPITSSSPLLERIIHWSKDDLHSTLSSTPIMREASSSSSSSSSFSSSTLSSSSPPSSSSSTPSSLSTSSLSSLDSVLPPSSALPQHLEAKLNFQTKNQVNVQTSHHHYTSRSSSSSASPSSTSSSSSTSPTWSSTSQHTPPRDLMTHPPISHPASSTTPWQPELEERRNVLTVPLSFPFPFYGHEINQVTITTGGFLYVSDFLHDWLSATQYVAPLMADFSSNFSDRSDVLYFDNGTSLVVWWKEAFTSRKKFGPFSFQAILERGGRIVFVYKLLSIPLVNISTTYQPVKVGLSDAYYLDRASEGSRRRTIYEYHKVQVNISSIQQGSVVLIDPLPTCRSMKTCIDCIIAAGRLPFNCQWCSALERCSDGMDRQRQKWMESGCPEDRVRSLVNCGDLIHLASQWLAGAKNTKQEWNPNPTVKFNFPPSFSGLGLVVLLVSIFSVSVCLYGLGWFAHACLHPSTRNGRWVIEHRPVNWKNQAARWSFKRRMNKSCKFLISVNQENESTA